MYGAIFTPTKPKIRLVIKNNTKKIAETTLKFMFADFSSIFTPKVPTKEMARQSPLPTERSKVYGSPLFAAKNPYPARTEIKIAVTVKKIFPFIQESP